MYHFLDSTYKWYICLVRLTSLSRIISRSIHVAAIVIFAFLFYDWEIFQCCLCVCIHTHCIFFFIHSSAMDNLVSSTSWLSGFCKATIFTGHKYLHDKHLKNLFLNLTFSAYFLNYLTSQNISLTLLSLLHNSFFPQLIPPSL